MVLDNYIIKDINRLNNISTKYIEDLSSFNYGIDNINVLALNIRSIFANFDELVLLLNSNNSNFDIIVLTETWLLYDFKFELNGYNIINSLGKINKNDGVTVFIKNSLKLINISYNMITDCNSIEISLDIDNKFINIIGIYRSPNSNIDNFLESLNNYLEHLDDHNKRFIIAGDMNINIMDTYLSNDYLNIMASNNFISCINNYTRVTNTTKSCIDHIFTKNIDMHYINAFILECSITDHYGTIIQFKHQLNPNSTHKNKNNEKNKRVNIKFINETIDQVNWIKVLNTDKIDVAMSYFLHKIDEIIQNASYNISFNNPNKFNKLKAWTTKGLVISIKNKHKMSKKLLLSPFDFNLKMKYIKYRNLLTSLITKAKKMHYQVLFKKYKYNPKKIWQLTNEIAGKPKTKNIIINEIKNNNCILKDSVDIANEFNKYFINVGNEIEKNILKNNFIKKNWDDLNTKCHVKDSIFLTPITRDEIIKYIKKIKDHSTFVEYGITNFILKNIADSLSLPLMILFNLSMSSGTYPTYFKKCMVTPIHKQGDKLLCSNYRPISLSLTLSKIYEKCIKYRIISFLDKNTFFSKNQFGFLKGKSTSDAHFFLNKYVHEHLDQNNKVLAIFLDIKKAFDCVNHQLLLKKLNYAGIRGIANNLISSYLNDRHQIVKINDKFSKSLSVTMVYLREQSWVRYFLFYI